ncbi:MAG: hypothetical protein FJZ56_06565 [Chlamydiae bacterium]|nr:hypothetical protein [Chlamydiota bacterium]MBM3202053.1 hypothetical protein [Chlamydiota bacterium]
MNFTREPIIESIISARDGYKLSIRSTKMQENREILVDAVEIVSFGNSHFFRCQEKPKPFFFPVGDYEVSEVKETRFILKNSTLEKSVKIQSSKEHLHKSSKETIDEESIVEEEIAEDIKEEISEETPDVPSREDKKSKRNRRKRDRQKQQRFTPTEVTQEEVSTEGDKGGDTKDEALVSSPTSIAPKFISPPPALIISSLSHRKSETVHQEPLLPTSPLEINELPLQEIQLNPTDEVHSLFSQNNSQQEESTSLETSKDV